MQFQTRQDSGMENLDARAISALWSVALWRSIAPSAVIQILSKNQVPALLCLVAKRGRATL